MAQLAVQAAHAAVGRGWFAGGVLFTDIFGYDPGRRLTAAQAAAGFVRALGIPGEHIPLAPRTWSGCCGRCWTPTPPRAARS